MNKNVILSTTTSWFFTCFFNYALCRRGKTLSWHENVCFKTVIIVVGH